MVPIAFDTETHLISRESPLPKMVCATFKTAEVNEIYKWGPDLKALFEAMLDNPKILFIGCNTAYDFGVLGITCPELLPKIFDAYRCGRVTDIAIRQQLFDIAYGRTWGDDQVRYYSLATLAKEILNVKMGGKSVTLREEDAWRLRYSELENVDIEDWPQSALDYALGDADVTYRIWKAQNDEIEAIMRDDTQQAYAAFVLTLIQARGMLTDPEAVKRCKERHEDTLRASTHTLANAGLLRWDDRNERWVKSDKAARERIAQACRERGIEPNTTVKGAISCDRAACILSGDALMLERCRYVTAEKVLSTNIPVLEQGYYAPITTRFKMAATGRTTSSAPGDPLVGTNLQNAPRTGGVRECFRPRNGYLYLAADFSGAELHTLAQYLYDTFKKSTLMDVLNAGKDVHLWTAASILGINYNEAKSRLHNGDTEVKKTRGEAKAINFGFPGGMGPKTFRLNQIKQAEKVWEIDTIKRFKQHWLEAFPEMVDFFNLAQYELGPMSKAQIEIQPSGRLRTVSSFPACCNTKFQAPAADGAKRALCEVVRRCYTDKDSSLYGSYPVNFIHDEILLEVPDYAPIYQKAAIELKQCMAEEFNIVTPDCPTEVEPVLMRYWSKKAEYLTDEDGGIIPWG